MTQEPLLQSSPRPTAQDPPGAGSSSPWVASASYWPSASTSLDPVSLQPSSERMCLPLRPAHPRPSGFSRHPPSGCRDLAIKAYCLARACLQTALGLLWPGKRTCMCRFSWRERRRRGLCDRLGNERSRLCGFRGAGRACGGSRGAAWRKGAGPSVSTPAHMGASCGVPGRPLSVHPPKGCLPFSWSFCPSFGSPGRGTPILVSGSVSLLWYFAVAAPRILVTSSDSPSSCRCSGAFPAVCTLPFDPQTCPVPVDVTHPIFFPSCFLFSSGIPFALAPTLSLHGPIILASL